MSAEYSVEEVRTVVDGLWARVRPSAVHAEYLRRATSMLTAYAERIEAAQVGCCCGEPCTIGTVHRTDGPCFVYAEPTSELPTHPHSPDAADSGRVGDLVTRCRVAAEKLSDGVFVGGDVVGLLNEVGAALAAQGQGEAVDGDAPCAKCGSSSVDTGFECNDCGHDNAPPASPAGVPDADIFWNPYNIEEGYSSIESALQDATEAGHEGVLTIQCATRLPDMRVIPIIDQHGTVIGYKDAPSATPEGDGVPTNCRERLRMEGKPYPRSGCAGCGKWSPRWRECSAALSAKPAGAGGAG